MTAHMEYVFFSGIVHFFLVREGCADSQRKQLTKAKDSCKRLPRIVESPVSMQVCQGLEAVLTRFTQNALQPKNRL